MKKRNTISNTTNALGKMKIFSICVALIFCSNISAQSIDKGAERSKPNIIFILADDLGYGDVGFNGQDKIKTPVLDKMATEGIVFNRHYAGSAVCGPSRASLMTGMHTGNSSVRENPKWTKSGQPVDLSLNDVTVAEELKRADYNTGIIGKWGLSENLNEGAPNLQGFDYFYGFNKHKSAHHYYPETIWENDKLITIEGNVTQDKIGTYSQDLFTDKALAFLDNQTSEKPFFLYLAYTIPHFELTIPEDQKAQYSNLNWPLRKMKMAHYRHDENGHVTYASMVSRLDKDVGRILNKLIEMGVDDNTLVVFTSDNGHEYDNLKDEFFDSNGIYRGKKRDLYEGGLRMPFVARWPNKIKPGSATNHVSAFWDFLPTACDIAGVKPTAKINGMSYLPALTNAENIQKNHDYLYWEFNEKRGPMQALLKDDWKLVHFVNKHYELYNLKNDPSELNEISSQHPDILKQLKAVLQIARTEHPEFPLIKKELKK
ncbi:arylsulfatase [Algibacter mikhailovii]|uniref:Arylsulfatase n=1 Tax=Algibacter mikhailovii TaxID=425498 RepID=A0A918RCH9_9FLAO|nr:arylsulfatase [Algibacter mikhailovii]GGZ92054.1 arylsulfatase [Algibacter mikhailovii]